TPLQIEKHAAKVYTKTVFSEVQMEIETTCFRCVSVHIEKEHENTKYKVVEVGQDGVDFIINKCGDSVDCSCKKFQQFGLLCRHTMMLIKDLERIPEKYLLNRWFKFASSGHEIDNARLNALNGKNQRNAYLNNLWSDFHCCITLAEGSKDKLERLSRIINEEKNQLLGAQQVSNSILSKEAVIQELCGLVSNLDVDTYHQSKQKQEEWKQHKNLIAVTIRKIYQRKSKAEKTLPSKPTPAHYFRSKFAAQFQPPARLLQPTHHGLYNEPNHQQPAGSTSSACSDAGSDVVSATGKPKPANSNTASALVTSFGNIGPNPAPQTEQLPGAPTINTGASEPTILYVREDGAVVTTGTRPAGTSTANHNTAGTPTTTPKSPLSFRDAITGRRDGSSNGPRPALKEFILDGDYANACGTIIRSEANRVKVRFSQAEAVTLAG
ncbi:Protein FAR1-RELATED SEQUENCE 3, partial [Striga hermonthica]